MRLPSALDLFDLFPSNVVCSRLLLASSSVSLEECGGRHGQHIWRQDGPRLFSCQHCTRRVSPTAGTMFENCNIEMRAFFLAALTFAQSPRLVAAAQLSDLLGISHNSAVKLRNKLWRRLVEIAPSKPLGGPGIPVEVDELLVSRWIRRRSTATRWTAVGMTDRQTFRVFLAPDRRRETLLRLIRQTVLPGSIVHTDGWRGYRTLKSEGFTHLWCDHSAGIFKGADGATTTTIDGYWREAKLSLSHTHQGVSEGLLELFLRAHAARYSFSKRPAELFWSLVGCDPALLEAAKTDEEGWETCTRYTASRRSRGSFLHQFAFFGNEQSARLALTSIALNRRIECSACGEPRISNGTASEGRFRCRLCGRSETIRAGTIFAGSKVPLRQWFALIWLMSKCRDGVSVAYAARFSGVSRQAAITMLHAIRVSMSKCQEQAQIGGGAHPVDVGLFRLRVRRPKGKPRSTSRTVALGFDGVYFSADVLHQRSSRYVMLWAKKRIRADSEIRHPGGQAFVLLRDLPEMHVIRDKRKRKHSPARGTMAGVKRNLIRYHTRVPYARLQQHLKELEFKRCHEGKEFLTQLAAIAYGDPMAIDE